MKKVSKFFLYKVGKHFGDVDEGSLTKFGMRFRLFFARKISPGISKKANIHKGARIVGDGKNLIIEEHAALGVNCICSSSVFIGKHTMMGPDVTIYTSNHFFNIEKNVFDGSIDKPVYIGQHCWIGKSVIILPGAHIGNYCIVGAGAVVPGKNYPDYSVIVGNPAEIKKKLKEE